METPELREIKKVVNSHASDIQALTAVVHGLASQLFASQGQEGLDAAQARTITIANSMGSAFSVRPNNTLISQVFSNAKQPI